jgi:PAT family beta-lactamase induction signal transducer AmpG
MRHGQEMNPKVSKSWAYVSTLYIAEGLVYMMVNVTAVTMYKKMGISNAIIARSTSLLYLPWVIKMFWSPLVDGFSTKRSWIISTQFCMALLFVLGAFVVPTPVFFYSTLAVFGILAFASATHDISVDGYYMLALSPKEQAYFVGIRSGFYRVGMVIATGALVYIAGKIEIRSGNIPLSWMTVLIISGVIYGILALYHKFILPRPEDSLQQHEKSTKSEIPFVEAFRTYFSQKGVVPLIFFILFYRLGEALLSKLISPFLLDSPSTGGLGLATTEVGKVYGTFGMGGLIVGGILGGVTISRFGLRRCIWPMVVLLNLPDLFYVYMAWAKPSLLLVYPLITFEQFGYGFGLSAFMMVLIHFAKGRYKTSHYAISTGIMALGMMVPGMVSGDIQEALGYFYFFVFATVMTVPGMISIVFVRKESW